MNNKYFVNINCVVLSTDIAHNKQYVLSLRNDEIEFPSFECNNQFLENAESYLIQYIKKYIFVSDFELLSQLININQQQTQNDESIINIVYGFLTKKTINISSDVHWFEFDYYKPNKYNNILLEVTQKLK